jgi:hypothetical protein
MSLNFIKEGNGNPSINDLRFLFFAALFPTLASPLPTTIESDTFENRSGRVETKTGRSTKNNDFDGRKD